MASTSTSKLGQCRTCNVNAARYTCPACSFPSCSLPCSRSHKTTQPCSGIAAPVWSQLLKASEMSWGPLMRDQSYIASVGRKAEEIGRELVKDKLIPTGYRAQSALEDRAVERLDDNDGKENKMVYEARNEGVELVLLPKGMSKRTKNPTRYDQKNKRMEWLVEVVFHPSPSSPSTSTASRITAPPQPSTVTLYAALKAAFNSRDKKGKGKQLDVEDSKWIELQKNWLEGFKPVERLPKPTAESAIQSTEEKDKVVQEREPTMAEGGGEVEEAITITLGAGVAENLVNPDDGVEGVEKAEEEDVGDEEEDEEEEEDDDPAELDESPLILLLSLFAKPLISTERQQTAEEDEAATEATRSAPKFEVVSKVAPKKVFVISPHLPTLRHALIGATLLEHPSFELMSREAFLRARLLGNLEVVDQPRSVAVSKDRRIGGGNWERGRGRGRGRGGRGRGTGRGTVRGQGYGASRGHRGRSGHRGGFEGSSSSGGWRGGSASADGARQQDSGWGKRPATTSESEFAAKKPKFD